MTALEHTWMDFVHAYVGPALSMLLLGLVAWLLKRINVVHTLVNSQKQELERQVRLLRSALFASGIPLPPGTEVPYVPQAFPPAE